uniref:Leucine-rich repeat-containing N-terminal plant-type domain-containing protein n=1 Tax=Quercus lobata TaxID=97700 RepID=A0A7N2L4V3_QUELO
MLMRLLYILPLFHLVHSSPSKQPLCHDDESSALLQFKESFIIKNSASSDPVAYPRVRSWRLEGENSDCRSWNSVDCDEDTDWSSPLEETSLANTRFSNELPASMGNLDSLIALDMWGCNISGSLSSSIGNLTNLIYLKLSNNCLVGNIPSSIGNLIHLAFVDLYGNTLAGSIPFGLANMTKMDCR